MVDVSADCRHWWGTRPSPSGSWTLPCMTACPSTSTPPPWTVEFHCTRWCAQRCVSCKLLCRLLRTKCAIWSYSNVSLLTPVPLLEWAVVGSPNTESKFFVNIPQMIVLVVSKSMMGSLRRCMCADPHDYPGAGRRGLSQLHGQ